MTHHRPDPDAKPLRLALVLFSCLCLFTGSILVVLAAGAPPDHPRTAGPVILALMVLGAVGLNRAIRS